MTDRVLGHVDGCPDNDDPACERWGVPVIMHDDESVPDAVIVYLGQCDCRYCQTLPEIIRTRVEPPEITEARASLPERRPTDRDWFAEARRG